MPSLQVKSEQWKVCRIPLGITFVRREAKISSVLWQTMYQIFVEALGRKINTAHDTANS